MRNGNELWFLGNWGFQGLLRLMKAYLKLEIMSINETNLFVSGSHVYMNRCKYVRVRKLKITRVVVWPSTKRQEKGKNIGCM